MGIEQRSLKEPPDSSQKKIKSNRRIKYSSRENMQQTIFCSITLAADASVQHRSDLKGTYRKLDLTKHKYPIGMVIW
jgi:hypothetical protein